MCEIAKEDRPLSRWSQNRTKLNICIYQQRLCENVRNCKGRQAPGWVCPLLGGAARALSAGHACAAASMTHKRDLLTHKRDLLTHKRDLLTRALSAVPGSLITAVAAGDSGLGAHLRWPWVRAVVRKSDTRAHRTAPLVLYWLDRLPRADGVFRLV